MKLLINAGLKLFTIPLMSLKSIWSYKSRSFLAVLGIVVSVAAIITILSLLVGVKEKLLGEVENLGMQQIVVIPGKMIDKGPLLQNGVSALTSFHSTNSTLTQEDVLAVKNQSSIVKWAAPQYETYATASVPASKTVAPTSGTRSAQTPQKLTAEVLYTGTTADLAPIFGLEISAGRFLTPEDTQANKPVAVLGQTVKEQLFAADNAIGKEITLKGQKLQIVGVLNSKKILGENFDERIYTPVTVMTNSTGQKSAAMLFFQAKNLQLVNQAEKEIGHIIAKKHGTGDFSLVKPEEMLYVVNNMMQLLTMLITGVTGISLLVGGIGIMNVMLMSVQERRREIGLRKALGAQKWHILYQFLMEAVFLSGFGCVLGVGLAQAILQGIAWKLPLLAVSIPLWTVQLSVAFSLVAGVIFGLYPALKASLVNPITALHYE